MQCSKEFEALPHAVQDLLCVVLDVGATAHTLADQWPEVLQRAMANRMMQEKPHLELAIIAYGSDVTHNDLYDPADDVAYKGVRIVQVCMCVFPFLSTRSNGQSWECLLCAQIRALHQGIAPSSA